MSITKSIFKTRNELTEYLCYYRITSCNVYLCALKISFPLGYNLQFPAASAKRSPHFFDEKDPSCNATRMPLFLAKSRKSQENGKEVLRLHAVITWVKAARRRAPLLLAVCLCRAKPAPSAEMSMQLKQCSWGLSFVRLLTLGEGGAAGNTNDSWYFKRYRRKAEAVRNDGGK